MKLITIHRTTQALPSTGWLALIITTRLSPRSPRPQPRRYTYCPIQGEHIHAVITTKSMYLTPRSMLYVSGEAGRWFASFIFASFLCPSTIFRFSSKTRISNRRRCLELQRGRFFQEHSGVSICRKPINEVPITVVYTPLYSEDRQASRCNYLSSEATRHN